MQEAVQYFGPVDILVNNAGIMQKGYVNDLNEEMITKVLKVNCESNIWLVREVLPSMLSRNRGQIVTISSVAGLIGGPQMSDYYASKFASVGFSEALRCELKF
jgi:all-trans-retinol dehydrogenase (NAD+)